MAVSTRKSSSLDVSGSLAALVCAVHCLASPVLLSLGAMPLLGASLLESAMVEWGFVAATGVIGLASLVPSFTRVHRDRVPGILFTLGFGLLLATRLVEPTAALEPVAVATAAGLLIAAHVRNQRQCARCRQINGERCELEVTS
jgi:hypothetical protein